MTMRTLLLSAALIAAFSLTGCAAKSQYTGRADTTSASVSGKAASTSAPSSTTSPDSALATETMSDASLPDAANRRQDIKESVAEPKGELDTVYFDFDAFLLTAEARQVVDRNGRFLGANDASRVSLEGHADERGSDEYNLALAEQRAVAVRRYLVSLGIGEDRLEVVSYGEDKPAVTGADEAAWARNRRVEFVIIK